MNIVVQDDHRLRLRSGQTFALDFSYFAIFVSFGSNLLKASGRQFLTRGAKTAPSRLPRPAELFGNLTVITLHPDRFPIPEPRSEERRVGKECRTCWWRDT